MDIKEPPPMSASLSLLTSFCVSCSVSVFCVYLFFILVHHPGTKIKRSDSSSSISSQSPIGWLLSFVPVTHALARWEWLAS